MNFIKNMQIFKIQSNTNVKNQYISTPVFKSKFPILTIGNLNLGAARNGYLGKLKTIKASGEEVFLNLNKSTYSNYEIYNLTDNFDNIIGKIEFRMNKYLSQSEDEMDHIFVTEVKNFSNPNTPYYKNGLEEHKHIGTKLLQIALKRSFETGCNGNIELVAKNKKEVLEFYKRLGFKQPANIPKYGNPYRLHLSEESKDQLSKKYGGL